MKQTTAPLLLMTGLFSGVWNETESWPLMFKATETTGALPAFQQVSQSCTNKSHFLIWHGPLVESAMAACQHRRARYC